MLLSDDPITPVPQLSMQHSQPHKSPELAKGQFWRTNRGLVQIVELGKKLVYYRLTKDRNGVGLTRMIRREALQSQLEAVSATLLG